MPSDAEILAGLLGGELAVHRSPEQVGKALSEARADERRKIADELRELSFRPACNEVRRGLREIANRLERKV